MQRGIENSILNRLSEMSMSQKTRHVTSNVIGSPRRLPVRNCFSDIRLCLVLTIILSAIFVSTGVEAKAHFEDVRSRLSRATTTYQNKNQARRASSKKILELLARLKVAESRIATFIAEFPNDGLFVTNSGIVSFRLGQAMSNCRSKISAIENEKAVALAELARGERCSQCGRTKSEIERGVGKNSKPERSKSANIPEGSFGIVLSGREPVGESFSKHLDNVDGTVVRASQAELDAKAAEYEAKMRPFRQRLKDAQQAEAEAKDVSSRIMFEWSTWNASAFQERSAFETIWEATRDIQEDRVYQARQKLSVARRKQRETKSNSPLYKSTVAAISSSQSLVDSEVNRLVELRNSWIDRAGQVNTDFADDKKRLSDAGKESVGYSGWGPTLLSMQGGTYRVNVSGINTAGYPINNGSSSRSDWSW